MAPRWNKKVDIYMETNEGRSFGVKRYVVLVKMV